MDEEGRKFTLKVISIQDYHGNHGNVIHSKHGYGTQPNKNFKVPTIIDLFQ